MKNKQILTIKDIAKLAGVNKSTVSLAMRNSPRISKATAEKIKKIARKIGYRPNIIFSIMASGNRKSLRKNLAPVACLFDTGEHNKNYRSNYIFRNLTKIAEKYGYYIEYFDLFDEKSPTSFEKMLYSRGFCGIIIERITNLKSIAYELKLDRFSVVVSGNTFKKFIYNRVTSDSYAAAQLAWDKAKERGYRRIGTATCFHTPLLPDDELRLAAVLQRQFRDDNIIERIPPFLGHPDDSVSFKKWYLKHKPDCIIGLHLDHYNSLKELGVKIPDETGFACLIVHAQDKWWKNISGIIAEGWDELPNRVLSLLDQEIRSREIGIPQKQVLILVEPQWHEAKTLKK